MSGYGSVLIVLGMIGVGYQTVIAEALSFSVVIALIVSPGDKA